jgi:hypothetical protein
MGVTGIRVPGCIRVGHQCRKVYVTCVPSFQPFRTWTHEIRYAAHDSGMFSILSAPSKSTLARARCSCMIAHTQLPGNHSLLLISRCPPFPPTLRAGNQRRKARKTDRKAWDGKSATLQVLPSSCTSCVCPCACDLARVGLILDTVRRRR